MKKERLTQKRVAILVVIIALAIIGSVAAWEFVIKDYVISTSDGETEYSIDIWQGNEKVGKVSMSELEGLSTVSYQDTLGSGAIDEGPLVMDVILLEFDISELSNSTAVHIWSDLTGEERMVTWGEISNVSNSYILDFTNKGTTKFSSPDTQKKDRVRDVTDIEVGA